MNPAHTGRLTFVAWRRAIALSEARALWHLVRAHGRLPARMAPTRWEWT